MANGNNKMHLVCRKIFLLCFAPTVDCSPRTNYLVAVQHAFGTAATAVQRSAPACPVPSLLALPPSGGASAPGSHVRKNCAEKCYQPRVAPLPQKRKLVEPAIQFGKAGRVRAAPRMVAYCQGQTGPRGQAPPLGPSYRDDNHRGPR